MTDKEFYHYHRIDRDSAAKIMWAHGWVIMSPRATPPAYMAPDDYGTPSWDFPLHDYDGRILHNDPHYRSPDDCAKKS